MGSSSSQTIGYEYHLGMHVGLVRGPVDFIREIKFDDRVAWSGISTGGRISFQNKKLFGGEKREGGVGGDIDFEPGYPDQTANDYLAAQLGTPLPAFRGLSALVFRQFYFGMSPYLKPISVKAQRVNVRTNGEAQWYAEKAPIGELLSAPLALYIAIDLSGSMDEVTSNGQTRLQNMKTSLAGALNSIKSLITSGIAGNRIDIMIVGWGGTTMDFMARVSTTERDVTVADIDTLITWVNARTAPYGTYFPSAVADAAAFFDGSPSDSTRVSLFITDGQPVLPGGGDAGEAIEAATAAGATLLSIPGLNAYGFNIDQSDTDQTAKMTNASLGVQVVRGGNPDELQNVMQLAISGQVDMNGAHIIREALTDPAFGMGYPETDIDEASFTACADQLFSEGMGLSLIWDRQSSIEDFIKVVCDHIDATLYVSRETGKFVLKLIRNDYDVDEILELGPADIDRVENFGAPSFGELASAVTVIYKNWRSEQDASITVHDQALAIQQGGTVAKTREYPGFSNQNIASRAAFRDLRGLSVPLNSCTVYATRKAESLHPGDVFLFNWPECTADRDEEDNLVNNKPMVMRVTDVAIGDGINNMVRLQCVADVFALGPAAIVASMPTKWADPATRPVPATSRYVWEAPYWQMVRQVGEAQVGMTLEYHPEAGFLMSTAKRPGVAINADVWVDAGAGYTFSFTTDFSPWAVTHADVLPGDTVIEVDDPVDLDDAQVGRLAFLGQELVRIDDIDTSIVPHVITIGRGCLDTVPPLLHATGTPLVFWVDFADYSTTEFSAGEIVDVKMLPTGGDSQVNISVATPDELEFNQRALRPYPPGDFKINGEAYPEEIEVETLTATDAISVSWAHRDRKLQTGAAVEDTSVGNIGPEDGTTYSVQLINPATDALFAEETGITGTVAEFSLSGYTGSALRTLLWAVRDSLISWQAHEWEAPLSFTPWTPQVYAASARWFDFSDASTVTLTSGIRIVANKGAGNGLSQESIPAARPAYALAAHNGLNVARFNGVDQFLYANNISAFRAVGNGVVFIVAAPDVVSGAIQTMFNHNTPATTALARIAMSINASAAPEFGGRRTDAQSFQGITSPTVIDASMHIFCARYDWATAQLSIRVDGDDHVVAASFQTAGNTSNTDASTNSSLGASRSATVTNQGFDGDIGEVVFMGYALADENVHRFEGYFAWKWGIQHKLPVGHPYKSAPPVL